MGIATPRWRFGRRVFSLCCCCSVFTRPRCSTSSCKGVPMTPELSLRLNAAGLLAVSVVLIFAFADQLFLKDLPCPLCILQRAAFIVAGFGLALNLRFGPRAS